jgi:hypothetical protein
VLRAVPAVSSTHVMPDRTPENDPDAGALDDVPELDDDDGLGFGFGFGLGLLVALLVGEGDGVGVGVLQGRSGKHVSADASIGASTASAQPTAAAMIATRLRIR